jgi:fido (protein-threonine AMPylation protein)
MKNGGNEDFFPTIKKYIFVPTAPDDVESEMKFFIESLYKMLQDGESVIKVAAYVHMRITGIHPFPDANGRTARLMMNIILMQAGFLPVVVRIKEKYDKSLKDWETDPVAFENYLLKNCDNMERGVRNGFLPMEEKRKTQEDCSIQ